MFSAREHDGLLEIPSHPVFRVEDNNHKEENA